LSLDNEKNCFMASRKSRPVALVTDSSSGIGLELAKIFAADGYDVILTSPDRGRLELAVDQVKRAAPEAGIRNIVADLAKPAGRKKLYGSAKRNARSMFLSTMPAGAYGASSSRPISKMSLQ
jgi:NAD(P)-dependent dehydrogenase (short-subunit alcohol dehydrogenase family)